VKGKSRTHGMIMIFGSDVPLYYKDIVYVGDLTFNKKSIMG